MRPRFVDILRVNMNLVYLFIPVLSRINGILKISLSFHHPTFLSFCEISFIAKRSFIEPRCITYTDYVWIEYKDKFNNWPELMFYLFVICYILLEFWHPYKLIRGFWGLCVGCNIFRLGCALVQTFVITKSFLYIKPMQSEAKKRKAQLQEANRKKRAQRVEHKMAAVARERAWAERLAELQRLEEEKKISMSWNFCSLHLQS